MARTGSCRRDRADRRDRIVKLLDGGGQAAGQSGPRVRGRIEIHGHLRVGGGVDGCLPPRSGGAPVERSVSSIGQFHRSVTLCHKPMTLPA